jgi:hypothetical protein
MPQSAGVWEIIGALGSLLIGLFATAASLLYLVRQTRASERATTAAVYQSLIAMGHSIADMFRERPELYAQIFGHPLIPSPGSLIQEQLTNPRRFYAAAKFLDYFEIILVLWPSIPESLQGPWKAYIKTQLANSPYLRRMLLDTHWYGDDLKQLCREAEELQQKV